jgi:predicted nucleotidyltransferase
MNTKVCSIPYKSNAMLDSKDSLIAQKLKSRLAQITQIDQLVIFGSRARGNSNRESDMDVFIEVPALTPDLRRSISEIAWEVGLENDLLISTLVATPDDIQDGLLGANPILRAIEKEGVAI